MSDDGACTIVLLLVDTIRLVTDPCNTRTSSMIVCFHFSCDADSGGEERRVPVKCWHHTVQPSYFRIWFWDLVEFATSSPASDSAELKDLARSCHHNEYIDLVSLHERSHLAGSAGMASHVSRGVARGIYVVPWRVAGARQLQRPPAS